MVLVLSADHMRELLLMVKNVRFHPVVIELLSYLWTPLSRLAQSTQERQKIADNAHLIHVT